MISVQQKGSGLIGDSLSMVPFLAGVVEKHGEPVMVNERFAPVVKELLSEMPIHFSDQVENPAYKIDVFQAFSHTHSGHNLHMAQAYFEMTRMGAAPQLPITLPFVSTPSPVPAGGIVISPLSVSDHSHNKCWFEDRWAAVIQAMRVSPPVYVLGGHGDNVDPYIEAGAIPIVGHPLTSVLSMLRECRLFISVDNGISHLAHFGGVRHHVLLYPICLNPHWVPNPGAKIIRNLPMNIEVTTVMAAIHEVLDRQ
jgi:hypothetical protein